VSQITTIPRQFEKLDRRENDGIEVSLLWNRGKNEAVVVVADGKSSETSRENPRTQSTRGLPTPPTAGTQHPSEAASHLNALQLASTARSKFVWFGVTINVWRPLLSHWSFVF
jgi:hypothetical protein